MLRLALPEVTERPSHGEPTWYLDVPGTDWSEIDELVRDAYRLIAPKRLAAELDQV